MKNQVRALTFLIWIFISGGPVSISQFLNKKNYVGRWFFSHSAARFPSILSGFMLCVVWSSLNRRLFFFYGLKNLSSHMRRGTFNGPVSALGVDFHAECLGLERERERESWNGFQFHHSKHMTEAPDLPPRFPPPSKDFQRSLDHLMNGPVGS